MSFNLTVQKPIFDALPNLKIFVTVLKNLDHSKIDFQACNALLDEAWKDVPNKLSTYPNVQSHPNIHAWRTAYKNLKIPTSKYTCSLENLVKRASKTESLPVHINSLVDFYNSFSLSFFTPFGGFDMDDSDVCRDMEVRLSCSGDKFLALDATEPLELPIGEAVYAYKDVIITRHVNWKQSKDGLIKPDSKNIVLMTEVLVGNETIDAIRNSMAEKARVVLGVNPDFFTIDSENPSISF